MKIELPEEELDGCMTKEEYGEIWQYARLRNRSEMVGLLAFAEQIDRTTHPLQAFVQSQLMWMTYVREQRSDETEELSDEETSSRTVH